MKNETLTKGDLNKALEDQSSTIIKAIETEATNVRNDILDRIDRLEK